jgi:hypothetical protein
MNRASAVTALPLLLLIGAAPIPVFFGKVCLGLSRPDP